MALFSGKIIEAHYIDHEYSIVEILYAGDDGNVYSHALRADPNNQEWKDLIADGWDQDKLAEGTAEYKRQTSASFNIEVNAAAKLIVNEILVSERKAIIKKVQNLTEKEKSLENLDRSTRNKTQDMLSEVWSHVLEQNTDKDMLFQFKLWVLEQDFIKNATKEEKSAVRKAMKISQIFGLIDKYLE
jgi:hypothetical protein